MIITLDQLAPMGVTFTPTPGLVAPVKVGTVVGSVTLARTDAVRGIYLDGPDAAKFKVGGVFPNYKIWNAVELNGSYRLPIPMLLANAYLTVTVKPAVVPPPPPPPPPSAWPNRTNTGVPAGTVLTPATKTKLPPGCAFSGSGSLVVSQPGAISGWDIQAPVYIQADNVTLQNCKVTAANFFVVETVGKNTTIQNCTINGTGANNDGCNGIWGTGIFTANDISNVENGIALFDNGAVIKDNYIHDLKASGSPHYDGIQIDGNISNVLIQHNTIINDFGQTSAVMIDNNDGPISNITVDTNLLVGGGYTIYVDGHFNNNPITGVSITNNHMGTGSGGITDFNGTSPTYTGNAEDGAALAAALP